MPGGGMESNTVIKLSITYETSRGLHKLLGVGLTLQVPLSSRSTLSLNYGLASRVYCRIKHLLVS